MNRFIVHTPVSDQYYNCYFHYLATLIEQLCNDQFDCFPVFLGQFSKVRFCSRESDVQLIWVSLVLSSVYSVEPRIALFRFYFMIKRYT